MVGAGSWGRLLIGQFLAATEKSCRDQTQNAVGQWTEGPGILGSHSGSHLERSGRGAERVEDIEASHADGREGAGRRDTQTAPASSPAVDRDRPLLM